MSKDKVDIPGMDELRKLAEEYDAREAITSLPPLDVSDIKDAGMQGVVALATACKWNVLRKTNKPIMLRSRNGTTLAIPTDTSIRFSVFIQRLHSVARDSITVVITPELIEQIITRFKLDHDHAREFRKIVEADIPHEEEPMNEPEPVYQRPVPTRATRGMPMPSPDATVVEREPWVAHGSDGRQYVSEASYRRVWSDGAVDYECTFCGEAYLTGHACSAHFGYHVKRGERPKQGERQYVGEVDREWLRETHRRKDEREQRRGRGRPPAVENQEMRWADPPPQEEPQPPRITVEQFHREDVMAAEPAINVDTVAEMVRTLINVATQQITAERDAALAEVERLKGNLKGLRDLIGEDL
jgi:hypothetical protein